MSSQRYPTFNIVIHFGIMVNMFTELAWLPTPTVISTVIAEPWGKGTQYMFTAVVIILIVILLL